MADRSISISLEAKVGGFVAGMKTAAQATKDAENRLASFAKNHEQSLDRVGKAGMVMGGALLAGVGLAVKSFADFDKAMSEVRASTHETAGNMDLLRTAAINAGADTAFSASEAANAIDEMAKAGVSTKDILSGGLKGALSLAAAGSLGVGDAAELAATAMTQFKLAGTDLPHVADLLAAGAGKAQGSVGDMGMALKQSGLVANMFGVSIEETAGSLAAFASQGLIGSDAGTSFKQSLLMLAKPSKESAAAMADLGISAYDAQGKFVGMANLAGQLKDKMGPLTDAQRQSAMATIFGSDAIRVANALYSEGAQGITDWTNKVNDAGYAASTAAIKQDNLAGDFEKLTGSLDSVFIKSADGANTALRGLVQGAEDFVDSVGNIPAPVLQAGLGIAGITGGVLLAGGAFTTALPKFMEGVSAFRELEKAAPRAGAALKGAGIVAGLFAVAGALGTIQTAVADSEIERSVGKTTAALIELSKQSSNIQQCSVLLDSLFQKKDGSAIVSGVQDLDSAMTRMFKKDWQQSFSDWGEGIIHGIAPGVKGASQVVDESFKTIDDQLASFVQSGNADLAAKAFKQLEDKAKLKGIDPAEFKAKFGSYSEALKQADADARVAAEGMEKITTATGQVVPITPEVAKALEDVGLSAQGAVVDIVKFTDAMLNAGLMQLSARDAARNFQAAIDAVSDSIAKNGTTLDTGTEKGRANQAALDGIAAAGFQVVKANAANGASQSTLQGNLTETYNKLIAGAAQFNITGTAAQNLAREILKVPPGVDIKSWMSDAAKRMAEQTAGAMNAIDGKTVHTYAIHHDTTIVTQERSDSLTPSRGTADKRSAAYASGGAIIGPGTGTSDEIPALLSNGEHVLTAAEVSRMGGQAAVYRFRQMLDAGKLPKFAVGGAVERANYRREQRDALNLDYARGQAYQTVNDSLSSAYSFSDRLRSVGTSGNVANGGALVAKANAADSVLRGLFSRSEKLSKSLETARAKFDSLVQVRDGIKSALSGEFKLGDAVKSAETLDAKGVQGVAAGVLARIRGFASKLQKLQKMGYSGAILQEIAGMGSEEGGAAADALLVGSKSDVRSLNSTYTAIGTASASAGTYVTDAMYKGGVKAAQGVLDGLTKQEKAIEKQMLKIGLSMENSLRSAVGARPLHKAGGGRVYGPGTETSDSVPHMLSKDEYVIQARAAKAIGYAELDRMNQGQMKPVITYRPARTQGAGAGGSAPVTNNWNITQQSNPVATAHEVARRQFARAT